MTNRFQKCLCYLVWLLGGLVFTIYPINILAAHDSPSSDQYTDRVINDLDEKFKLVKTDSVETLNVSYLKEGFTVQEGKLLETADNRWRWAGSTYAGKIVSDFLIVCDGSTVWSKDDLIQGVLKRPIGLDSSAKSFDLHLINTKRNKSALRVLGETELRPGQAVYEIECRMPEVPTSKRTENSDDVQSIKAWIGVDDGLLYRVAEYNKDGKEVSISIFKNYRLNIPIDPQMFHFEVPPGIHIVDLTQPNDESGFIKLQIKTKGRKPIRNN